MKKASISIVFSTIIFMMVMVFFTGNVWATDCLFINDGLVACYPFNGNADDGSGNSNHGTVYGATLRSDRFGNANSAYWFDGVDDYIKILSGPDIQGASQVTLTAWVKSNSVIGKDCTRVIEIGTTWEDSTALVLDTDTADCDGGLQGRVRGWIHANNIRQGEISTESNGINYNDDNWHFLVFTYNGSVTALYIDKVMEITGEASGIIDSPRIALIGAATFSSPTRDFFGGFIDDIRIYNRALSTSEIQQLYNEGNENCQKATYDSSTGQFHIPYVVVDGHDEYEVDLQKEWGRWSFILTGATPK